MIRVYWMLAALVFGALPVAEALGASFNCRPYTQRGQCPESLICSEESLSALDDQMAGLYFDVRRRMQSGHLKGFRDYQREWLARRNQCGCNYECLVSEYNSQIDALTKTLGGQ